jgi:hypothetical protein
MRKMRRARALKGSWAARKARTQDAECNGEGEGR